MEYLAFAETIEKKKDITDELEILLSNKALVSKPNALQWKFFRDCIKVLLNPKLESVFSSLSQSKTAQFKYEAEDRLKEYYLRPGRKINYAFRIVQKKEFIDIFNGKAVEYQSVSGFLY